MPKKDYDKWCKGKEGVEHGPVAVLHPDRQLAKLTKCGLREKHWICVHVVWCPTCKRVLRYEWQMQSDDCPDYEGKH